MKNIALSLGLVCAMGATAQKEFKFQVEGSLKGLSEGKKVYLGHKWNDKELLDSVIASQEKFQFSGKSPESNMYWLRVEGNRKNQLIFFVDEGKTSIQGESDKLDEAKVSGGKTQGEYENINAVIKGFEPEFQTCNNAYQKAASAGDEEGQKAAEEKFKAADARLVKELKQWVKSHPESPVSGFAIFAYFSDKIDDYKEYEELYGYLSEKNKQSKYGKIALKKAETVKATSVGNIALDFSQADVNGKMVSLSSFRGQYVLIDFWASWCGPCRGENPNVVQNFKKYQSKGFTVLGVSLDSNKEKWLAAIKKDNLTWTHVSDLKGWSNEAAVNYGVKGIPSNFLIDKEGRIIAKNLREAALGEKLKEIFGE